MLETGADFLLVISNRSIDAQAPTYRRYASIVRLNRVESPHTRQPIGTGIYRTSASAPIHFSSLHCYTIIRSRRPTPLIDA